MEILMLVGRLLFCAIFIGSGVGHLMATDETAAVAEKRGLKNARLLVQVSGVAMLLVGWAIALGVFMDIALLGVAAIVLTYCFTIHTFWKFSGDEKTMEMAMFMKNVSIAGAALFLFGFVVATQYGSMTITGPLIGR